MLTPRLPDSNCPAHTLPRTHLLALGRGCLSRGTLPVKTRAEVRTVPVLLYGGCRRRTQSLEDQLDRADTGTFGKSPTATPWRAELLVAFYSRVGDLCEFASSSSPS